MSRRDDHLFNPLGGRPLYDVPPCSISFPSQTRTHSRPVPYQKGIPFHEEHHEDGFPIDNSGRSSAINFPSCYRKDGALLDEAVAHSLERENTVISPVNYGRETPVVRVDSRGPGWQQPVAAAAPSQFNSPAHNFNQHLRERSPSSSSALLNLLNRYPSARQSIYLTTPRVYRTEERPTSTLAYRGATVPESNFPLVELAVPKPTHRTSSLPSNESREFDPYLTHSYHESGYLSTPTNYNSPSLSSQFSDYNSYDSHSPSNKGTNFEQPRNSYPQDPHYQNGYINNGNSNNGTIRYSETRTTQSNFGGPTVVETQTTTDYGNGPRIFYERTVEPSQERLPNQGLQPPHFADRNFQSQPVPIRERPTRDPLDISSLDAFVDDILSDSDMNRSTNQWRSSFAQMQDRFKQNEPDNYGSHEFMNNGSLTLPRNRQNNSFLTKSNSSADMRQADSLLVSAVDRRAAETPEFRKSPQLTQYWEKTVISAQPQTTPRQPVTLTAAERLQMLHEDPEAPPRTPMRRGSGEALAARRAQYQREAAGSFNPSQEATTPVNMPIRIHTNGGPNFSALEEAVHELQTGVRRTGYSEGARRTGGCARFPTEEFTLSPPRARTKIHSPSPDALSDVSSNYQMPSGLPHPKPKHNIKEQLYYAGLQQNTLPRSGLRTSPNFPVPSIGSVNSRISEFERRPGTPTLHNAHSPSEPVSPGPMSPRATVFKTKPIIHIEMGGNGRSTPIPSAFEFPTTTTPTPFKAPQWDSPESQKDISETSRLALDMEKLQLRSPQSPSMPGATSQPSSPHYSGSNGIKKRYDEDSLSPSFLNNSMNTSNSSNSIALNISPQADSKIGSPKGNGMERSIYEPAEPRMTPRSMRRHFQAPVNVPKFYYPQGKPVSNVENDGALRRALEVFKQLPDQKASKADLGEVLRAAGLPHYWKAPAHYAITGTQKDVTISNTDFSAWWRNLTSIAHDEAARFVYVVTGGKRDYFEREDLSNLVYDVIWTHPGLAFYHEAEEFHKHYVNIVITSVFWHVNRSWSGRINASELRRADFLDKLRYLEHEDDINKEAKYFSYEHFYVVYCKFWELDADHSMQITKQDLLAHNDQALTPLVVDRIFSGAVTRGRKKGPLETIGLSEFAMFLMADEDKRNPTSTEYWFRICDLDGDGILSLYEMELFYGQIVEKMEAEKIETMRFQDVICNLLDIVSPRSTTGFSLHDLKKTALSYRVFNSLVNVRKFFAQETNEQEKPIMKNDEGRELTDWEVYCDEEYETLMNEDEVDECHSVNLDEEDSRNNSYRDLL